MQAIIMRGLPGAGKDKFIKEMFSPDDMEIFCADDWHTFNGIYKYDQKRAAYAHDETFKAFTTAVMVEKHKKYLIVNNTNTTLLELNPYMRIAQVFGLQPKIIYIMCDLITAMKRNIHSVPPSTILNMHKNLLTEIVPSYWTQEVIY